MDNNFDIAVIGMSCRLPGADDPESFWNNLAGGIESVSRFTDEELRKSGVPDSLINNPNYVKASPVISEPGMFDAGLFGYTPMEARMMDPQHRILLECAYQAFEYAGYNPEKYSGRIGVFTGSAMNTYFMNNILRSKFVDEYIPTLIGNDKDFLATRISYKLNLKGPSINVQTACSTSLVAVHLACQSLISEESDMALAGAVSVKAPHKAGYICDGGGIVSRDAHVRSFDAEANGTVFGSGCGVVILKRLSDALRDGDTIYAVIKGSAVNNDGSEKAGYTAPAVNSQADAVIETLSLTDIEAETVTYIEAHGSGTPIGDPIEMAALTKAFRKFTSRSGFCAVGSVKSNVGHLDAAAGIAGFIKTILALKNKKIPPSINYSKPNPEIDFENSPFFVSSKLTDWESAGPRRAGIMSTGMGGTNAFLILEEAPAAKSSHMDSPALFTISAKNEAALDQSTRKLADFLEKNEDLNVVDAAYTLQQGRKSFNNRKFLVVNNRNDAVETFNKENSKRILSGNIQSNTKRPVIFLFPGIGDHYVGMGYDLYKNVSVFREEIDKCAHILNEYLDIDIRDVLYPKDYEINKPDNKSGIDLKKMLAGRADKSADSHTQKINRTLYSQPALFTIEYALAKLWMHLGITPEAIVGHSMGEYVAACLAGIFSLEDALKLIAVRAKLVNNLPQGGMIAVTLPEEEIIPLLSDGLSISLINTPSLCVVAGIEEKVNRFEEVLKSRKILYRHVQNAHAFHSKMLDPIYNELLNTARQIKFNSPRIPYTSNVTGNWISNKEATEPEYWAIHATNTARFSDALEKAWRIKDCILLEAGPGNTLGVLAMQHPESRKNENPITISSLRAAYENQHDTNYILNSIGKLWLAGIEINWDNLYANEKPKRIPLPTYSFQKENYWIEEKQESYLSEKPKVSIHKISNVSDWFYVPSWKRLIPISLNNEQIVSKLDKSENWLVFSDDLGISSGLIERLSLAKQDIITVNRGRSFNLNKDLFTIRYDEYSDYELLIKTLKEKNRIPDKIIHSWNITDDQNNSAGIDTFNFHQLLGFYSLLFLSKALAKNNINQSIKLFIVSNGLHEVTGTESLNPEKSTVIGPSLVIPQEYPNLKVKSIDIDINNVDKQIDYLAGELIDPTPDKFVAYRSNQRWIQTFEKIEVRSYNEKSSVFKKNGVYLITGGLGELGYEMAKYLAEKYKAKLVLVGRSQIPERKDWKGWIASSSGDDDTGKRIEKIQKLELMGSEVLYINANVADLKNMSEVIQKTNLKFRNLNGVIYAAGIVGRKGFFNIKDLDTEIINTHFRAKVHGLYNLEKILYGMDLDFCMLVSSLTPMLGGLGEVAYSSSNIFMDTFVRKHNLLVDNKWISINWDLWRIKRKTIEETGMGKTLAELGIFPYEGMEVMERVLAVKDVSQIVVSTGDLNSRINQWVKLESLDKGNLKYSESLTQSSYSQRPKLDVNYNKPRDETEKIIANIWQDALGIKQVGIDDNFSELGGHSLLAIKIISEIRKVFLVDLPVSSLFNSPTIIELADEIKEKILFDIQNLSDEDVKRMTSD